MPVPSPNRYLRHRQQDAESRQKSLGPLPVLLVLLHAVLEVRNSTSIAIAHQRIHLRLQNIEVAQYSVLVVPSLM